MGRFEPDYLAGQRVYVARKGLRPVGFASFHTGAAGWALDLLRPHPEAPDGTAHALVAAAIADAARAGVRAAVAGRGPRGGLRQRPWRRMLGLLSCLAPGVRQAAPGLRQFKQASRRAGSGSI